MKFALFIFVLFLSFPIAGQEIQVSGMYRSDADYFVNVGSDGTLEFFSNYGCCLLTDIYGIGTYETVDSLLRVETVTPEPERASSHRIVSELDENDLVEIEVINAYGPVEYCNVFLEDTHSKEGIGQVITDEEGVVHFYTEHFSISSDVTIRFSSFGMDTYSVPLNTILGHSIRVDLKPFRIIDNQIVLFKVKLKDNTVNLCGPIFPDSEHHNNSENRKMKGRNKLRMMLTHWPWDWNFEYSSHEAIPITFVKK